MNSSTSVAVSKNAFRFCRWSITIILWTAFFGKIEWLVWLSFALLTLSALLGVHRAPMILLFDWTLGHFLKSDQEMLNRPAMRFAHVIGAVLNLICIILLIKNPLIGWKVTLIFAIIKTVSAVGVCPASKLYGCMEQGGCCGISKKFFGE